MGDFMLFSRWGDQIKRLDLLSASHRQEINSTDELDISLREPLAKGDRILWDDGGTWREHVVSEESQSHDSGETFDAVCQSSMLEDLDLAHIRLWVANGVTAEQALSTVLELTSWEVGHVDDLGTNDITFERCSAYEAVCDIAGCWGAEIEPEVTVGKFGVSSRRVNLRKSVGRKTGVRFEYGHSITGVRKQILSDKVITACYGYGANLDTETDGVTDRLFCVVEDEEAKALWGLPDGKGGVMHAYGVFEDSDIDDSATLEAKTREHLSAHNSPSVSYETDIPFASLRGAGLGDEIQVVDAEFTPQLRLEARIGAIDRDLLSGETSSATFGTVVSVVPDVLARAYTASASAARAAEGVSAASIMSGMNGIYQMGGSYVCQTASGGLITANVPLDGAGNPISQSDGMTAVQFCGGAVRTSTTVGQDGSWEWSDAVSSGNVSADSVSIGGGTLTAKDGKLYFDGREISTVQQ